MNAIFGPLATFFGLILNTIYNLVNNYGLSLIIFTILIKILMLPISIKQQKTLRKSSEIQKEVKEIQKKYKGNQEKITQKTMELYRERKMNPFGGCLSGIVQILLLLSIFYLVSSPLTYMKQVNKETIEVNGEQVNMLEHYKSKMTPNSEFELDGNLIKTGNIAESYKEIAIIEVLGQYDDRVNINMDFIGIKLSSVLSSDWNDITAYIIPILYVISSVATIKLTTKMNKPKDDTPKTLNADGEPEIDMAEQMNKNMVFMMPILSVMIVLIAPLGLSLYWLMNNVLTIIEKLCIQKFVIDKEEMNNA